MERIYIWVLLQKRYAQFVRKSQSGYTSLVGVVVLSLYPWCRLQIEVQLVNSRAIAKCGVWVHWIKRRSDDLKKTSIPFWKLCLQWLWLGKQSLVIASISPTEMQATSSLILNNISKMTPSSQCSVLNVFYYKHHMQHPNLVRDTLWSVWHGNELFSTPHTSDSVITPNYLNYTKKD